MIHLKRLGVGVLTLSMSAAVIYGTIEYWPVVSIFYFALLLIAGCYVAGAAVLHK